MRAISVMPTGACRSILPTRMAGKFLCPTGFAAAWNGRLRIEDIQIDPDPGTIAPAVSHFAQGILTFHLPCLFRTDDGFDLFALGPINRPKDGIYPLAGIIETDWAPYTFTMNWIFTRPGVLRFDAGEPICHIFPVRRGELETVEPELRQISEVPEPISPTRSPAWRRLSTARCPF
jgi:Family of unknown function (DUF6065)